MRAPKYVLVLCSLSKEGDTNISFVWKAFDFSPRNPDNLRCVGWTSYLAWLNTLPVLEGETWINNALDLSEIAFKNRR
jgi:hypothetical protein